MKKLLVFPLNNDTEVLIKNRSICIDFEIIAISSYKQDTEKLIACQKKYDIYCGEFKECCEKVDAVLFADSTMGDILTGYEEKITYAYHKGLDIFVSKSLLEKISLSENITVNIIQNTGKVTTDLMITRKNKELITPVISIMGLGENSSKFELQVKINKNLVENGLKVLSISSNPLGKILDMLILPDYLFENNLSYVDKIKQFNLWIYQQEIKYKPDLIVIGIPGGIMPLNEFCENYFSELPLIISNSMVSDVGILTVYQRFNTPEFDYKNLTDLCKFKYGIVIENFIISDIYYKMDFEEEKVKYTKNVNESIVNLKNLNICSIEDNSKIEKQLSDILEQMENNIFAI